MGRKQFEAQLIAAEVGRMLGGMTGSSSHQSEPGVIGRAPNGDRIIHGDAMLKEMGLS